MITKGRFNNGVETHKILYLMSLYE